MADMGCFFEKNGLGPLGADLPPGYIVLYSERMGWTQPVGKLCTVPSHKFKYCLICPFKETNVFPFTIVNSCDA
jgi:hypothetical protein